MGTELTKTFSQRLLAWMYKNHHNQATLARALEVQRHCVWAWIHQENAPNAHCLKKLVQYTGISADWWLGLDRENVKWVGGSPCA